MYEASHGERSQIVIPEVQLLPILNHSVLQDPTTMLQLQKELAIQEERYADAKALQQQIFNHMTQSVMLRMVVAMEAALSDNRFEEAARVRDEYKRAVEAERSTADNSSLTSL
jgi:hypothetical protein